jgi:hypothetical protein
MTIKIWKPITIFFLALSFINQMSLASEDNLDFSSPPPYGYAKVRIWSSDFDKGIAGHVSLQTKGDKQYPAGAYISLWPNSNGDSVRYTGEITTKLSNNNEFVLDAPAVGMTCYKEDYINEDKKHADHVYLVKINTQIINKLAIDLLEKGIYSYGGKEGDKFILNDNFRWYAPGASHIFSKNIEENKTYLNCASSVMIALVLGGINESYIQHIYDKKTLTSNFLKSLKELMQEEHKESIHVLSELSQITIPGDVKDVLDAKMKDFFKKELIEKISSKKIEGVEADEISINKILEYLKSDLKDETKSIIDVIKKQGWLPHQYSNNLTLPKDLKEEIDSAKNVKNIAESVLVGVGTAAGVYVVAEIAKNYNCIVM